jgi:hypothetical protein
MLERLLGWRWSGLLGPARGAGRQEVLDADAPQQPKRPRRAVRSALLAWESGCSTLAGLPRVRVGWGSGLGERIGRCWTRTLLSSQSVLAGQDG